MYKYPQCNPTCGDELTCIATHNAIPTCGDKLTCITNQNAIQQLTCTTTNNAMQAFKGKSLKREGAMVYMMYNRNIASSFLRTSCISKLLKYKRGIHVNVPSIVKETYRDIIYTYLFGLC